MKSSGLFLLPFLFAALSGCGESDTKEAILDDMVTLMTEVGTVAQTATDKASSDAAAKKIDALTYRFEALTKRVKSIGLPSSEDQKRYAEQNESKLEDAMISMGNAALSLKDKPGTESAAAALSRFRKALHSFGAIKF